MELSIVEVGPTEDTVLALLDFLVDPLLPSKCLLMDPPSQEDLVAKQVHAVVLLYNYYHRKQNPRLQFLEFISFCQLAVALKPSLLSYLSSMQKSDCGELELEDLEKHMSLTEKEVVNACDVSRSLDASIDKPIIEGWPISKVTVFLVDFKKENCFLFHSSVTQGVWSVIEKEVMVPGEDGSNKKKRVIKKTPTGNQSMDEAALQQVAYLSVKEACAFNQGDLKILETHTVYSTSKAKTAARLYIMHCKHSKQDDNLVPISDALGSLQGPLVLKESGSWLLTPVVEYFHLLPFADKLSDWLSRSREMDANGTQEVETAEDGHCHSSDFKVEELPNPSHNFENVKDPDHYDSAHLNEKLAVNTSGSLGVAKQARNNNNRQTKEEVILNLSQHCEAIDSEIGSTSNSKRDVLPCFSNHSEMPKAVEDNGSSQRKDVPTEPVFVYKKRNRSQNDVSSNYRGSKKSNANKEYSTQEKESPVNGSSSSMDVDEPFRICLDGIHSNLFCDDEADDQKQIIVVQEPDQSTFNGGAIVVIENCDTNSHKQNADKVYSDQDEKQNRAIVSLNSDLEFVQKMQLTIASKKELLSQTELKALFRKKVLLSQRLRIIADEIDLSDRQIEIILKGGEDKLLVPNDSFMEGCSDLCQRSSATEKTGLHFEDPDLPPLSKRKRLSEANLSSHDPCRELDSICIDNSWTLPTYNISTLEGGFQASVTIKGEGALSRSPQDARNSAALHMLAKLQNMQV